MSVHIYIRGAYPTRQMQREALNKALSARFDVQVISYIEWFGLRDEQEPVEIVTVSGGTKTAHQQIAHCIQVWHQAQVYMELNPSTLRSLNPTVDITPYGSHPLWVAELISLRLNDSAIRSEST